MIDSTPIHKQIDQANDLKNRAKIAGYGFGFLVVAIFLAMIGLGYIGIIFSIIAVYFSISAIIPKKDKKVTNNV